MTAEINTPHDVQTLTEQIVRLFNKSDIHVTSQTLADAGYSFAVEGRYFSVFKYGVDTPFDDFIAEIFADNAAKQFKQQLLNNYKNGDEQHGNSATITDSNQ